MTRMLRAVLFGLVAVSASACSKSSTETSAKVVPGAAAGKVLEAKGTVTVRHGDSVRPLAVGDAVLSDDVVITAADGNVVIELAHNSARWELGPNKQSKVSESIAWNAKKETAQEIDEATAAAGRPAERSAAGTVAASADVEEAAPAEEAKADRAERAAAVPPADLPEPDMSSKGGGSAPPRPTRKASAPKAATAPPPADMMSSDDEAPAPRRTRGGIKAKSAKSAESAPLAPPATGGAAAAAAPAPGGGSMSAADSAAPSASSLLAAKATALHACMVTAGAKDDVTLTVDVVSGKATVKLASKASISAALERCLKGVVAGVHFSGSAKVTRVVKP